MRRFTKARLVFVILIFAVLIFGVPPAWFFLGDVFSAESGVFSLPADQLKSTTITAHLDEPIKPGRNVLWCSTFQLAWNELCTLIGEDVHFQADPPMVAILNKKSAKRDDIDEASCVAMAGWVNQGILDEIPKALKSKFKGEAKPHLIPAKSATRPQDIVAYSYLQKTMEFAIPFERLEHPIQWTGDQISCFGMDDYKSKHENMYAQVVIWDYQGPHDFIIELKTKSAGDQVLLAKITPKETLEATLKEVSERIKKGKPGPMETRDILKVPKLNFDLDREFSELEGQALKVANPKVAKDSVILQALQNIRFQLDEKGVKLRSEASIHIGCGGPGHGKHSMIFDKPFLILLRKPEAAAPYFALWVDNSELLVHQK